MLLVIIPIYGRLSQKLDRLLLIRVVNLFLAANLVLFSLFERAGANIAVVYFVWLGAYGVLVVAQFWAFTSDLYNKEAGERLFAVIALGASSGAWVGSLIARQITQILPVYEVMLLGAATLVISLLPLGFAITAIPRSSRQMEQKKVEQKKEEAKPSLFNGFKLVNSSGYLKAIALFVIVFNCLNSTGEFLLANLVELFYDQQIETGDNTLSKQAFIGRFYSTFYLMTNLVGFLIQAFLVSRVIKYLGVQIALIITPLITFVGYGLVAFIPVIALFRVIKISENSLDYSLQSTTRQVLYLPLSRAEKYEGRAVIDTFCWRLGDLVQGVVIFIGLNVFYLAIPRFLFINAVLAGILLALAIYIGNKYRQMTDKEPGTGTDSNDNSGQTETL